MKLIYKLVIASSLVAVTKIVSNYIISNEYNSDRNEHNSKFIEKAIKINPELKTYDTKDLKKQIEHVLSSYVKDESVESDNRLMDIINCNFTRVEIFGSMISFSKGSKPLRSFILVKKKINHEASN